MKCGISSGSMLFAKEPDYQSGTKFNILNHLLKIASVNFSYLLMWWSTCSVTTYIANKKMKTFHLAYVLTRLCAKNLFQKLSPNLSESTFHFGYLENSVAPDQPASSEAGWSGSTLFFKPVYAMLHNLERSNCIHLLKIASDCKIQLAFLEKASAKFDQNKRKKHCLF